ncbi:hypothetical protein [Corallococcus llansteffanensis]|uniref:Uncharacterized protein n=1 Tax=Corallococcus llansteffanensis TaxID=2316731 RepID=A0A3A8Q1C2_9BACT|nr:hypothetical protein [Corallococcus llansteffanensis]RKH62566.1 hypothetical protein D7V93_09970 [Corallococcus llansteffanensis]
MSINSLQRSRLFSAALFSAGLALGWPLFAGAKLQGGVCDPLDDEAEGFRLQLVSATADGVSLIPEDGVGPAGAIYGARALRPEDGTTGEALQATLFEAKPISGTGELYRQLRLQRQP